MPHTPEAKAIARMIGIAAGDSVKPHHETMRSREFAPSEQVQAPPEPRLMRAEDIFVEASTTDAIIQKVMIASEYGAAPSLSQAERDTARSSRTAAPAADRGAPETAPERVRER